MEELKDCSWRSTQAAVNVLLLAKTYPSLQSSSWMCVAVFSQACACAQGLGRRPISWDAAL